MLLLAILGWQQRWVSDDAFINLRVVDMLGDGHGPVFNVGERVEAYTSTLWIAVLGFGTAVLPLRLEWVAVIFGLALSLAGLAMASRAALGLIRDRGQTGVPLPLGALVFVALPPVWDFSTSGLETGLSFGWLGGSFLALVALLRREASSLRREAAVAVLLGLGPLVRPDFAVFSIAFLAALLVLARRPFRWDGVRLLAAAAVLPVPTSSSAWATSPRSCPTPPSRRRRAPATGAPASPTSGTSLWPYLLFLPLGALLARWAADFREDRRLANNARAVVAAAPVVAGAVHMLFVVKVGGDFMHARLLLPGLFALLMPVAVVAVPARRGALALAAGVAVWALVCAAVLRVPYHEASVADVPKEDIVDERSYYVALAGGVEHPVEIEDYRRSKSGTDGFAARDRAAAGERVVVFMGRNPEKQDELPGPVAARGGLRVPFVAAVSNVGVFGYAAGPGVYVEDRLALGSPVAARIELTDRGRVGHEKLLHKGWVHGRFGDPAAVASDSAAASAKRAFECNPYIWDGAGVRPSNWLRAHLEAVQEPLTAGRFLRNVKLAATSPKLRIKEDPNLAVADICGPYG